MELTSDDFAAEVFKATSAFKPTPFANHRGKKRRSVREMFDEFWDLVESQNGFAIFAIGDDLFFHDKTGRANRQNSVKVLRSVYDFYAVLGDFFQFKFTNGVGFVTKREFHSFVKWSAQRFEDWQEAPHFPPYPDTYYACGPSFKKGDGSTLDRLVSFFRPLTPKDRYIFKAMFVAGGIGNLSGEGAEGGIPAFIITSPKNDDRDGRGSGKTTLQKAVTRPWGKAMDIDPCPQQMERTINRMMSEGSRQKRTLRIENHEGPIRGDGFFRLLTNDDISGHKLFSGESDRRNRFVIVISKNEPIEADTDAAERAIVAKVDPVPKDEREFGFRGKVNRFIDEHRDELYGDIATICETEPPPRKSKFRFPALSRILSVIAGDDADAVEELILARQAGIDSQKERLHQIRIKFDDLLSEWTKGEFKLDERCYITLSVVEDVFAEIQRGHKGQKYTIDQIVSSFHFKNLRKTDYRRKFAGKDGCVTRPSLLLWNPTNDEIPLSLRSKLKVHRDTERDFPPTRR